MTFDSGTRRTFDLVVGADGIHSNTRRLAFGPEEDYHRYLGCSFAGFSMANELGLSQEGLCWNVPGRNVALFGIKDSDERAGRHDLPPGRAAPARPPRPRRPV